MHLFPRRGAAVLLFAAAVFFAAPRDASAQWPKILASVIENVNQLTDQFEKHSRIIEDHLAQATGLVGSFSSLNQAWRSWHSGSAYGRRGDRMVDVFHAHVADPNCYHRRSVAGAAACTTMSAFIPNGARQLMWKLPYTAYNVQNFVGGLPHWSFEDVVRAGWNGLIVGLSYDQDNPQRAQRYQAVFDAVRDSSHAVYRVRRSVNRNMQAGRWMMASVAQARHASQQVTMLDTSPLALASPLLTAGGALRDATGGSVGCAGLGFGATGTRGTPRTLLAQAMTADCNNNPTANLPMSGDQTVDAQRGMHLSGTEASTIRLGAEIVKTQQMAAELELRLIHEAQALDQVDMIVDAGRRQIRHNLNRAQMAAQPGACGERAFAWAAECGEGPIPASGRLYDPATGQDLGTANLHTTTGAALLASQTALAGG